MFLQKLHRAEHRRMLDGAHDQVMAAPLIGVRHSFDCEIGRLGPVRGEEDVLRGFRPDESRDLRARPGQRITRAQAVLMKRRGAAKRLGKKRAHGLEHFRQDRRAGLVVEVNLRHRGERMT
jgi:hypothetical protein